MKHILHSSDDHANPDDELHCVVCNGGLALCKVCGGAEASLPSECPGVTMTEDQETAVQAGTRDFCDGKWIDVV